MSLFSCSCPGKSSIDPKKVIIEGEIVGSFYSGNVEMTYLNDTEKLEEYTLQIGQSSGSSICLHDFKILIDNNPLSLKIMEKEEARRNYQIYKDDEQPVAFGLGNDSYTSLEIPYVLPSQTITVSANFELPISYPTKSTIEFFFPLTYPKEKSNDEILKCDDFHFSCKFNSLPLKQNSVTSNPEGKLNRNTSTYTIDHLDRNISKLAISYDMNPPVYSDDLDEARISTRSVLFNDGIASCCGRYGSVTFIPKKDGTYNSDNFGEEFIFIVDCSGSMSGSEIDLAAQCLIFFIKSIPENCFFNVIRFGSNYIPLFQKPVPYTDENSQKALDLAFSLKADLGGTRLSNPLKYVFEKPLSKPNRLRRVFVLTDGCAFDPAEVIQLVKKNSATTMCNAIGIGYSVDRKMVKEISQYGNGFFDFVLSGDDMRAKVIDQLSKSLDGVCRADITIENHSNIEIVPPLSESKLSPNEPVTFYFKSSKNLDDKTHVRIDIDGKTDPIILQMKTFSTSSRANACLQYSFNNENLRYLRNLEQTQGIKQKIIQLSIEYGILCPYTAFVGVQMYSSEKEKQRISQRIHDYKEREKNKKLLVKKPLTAIDGRIKVPVKMQKKSAQNIRIKVKKLTGQFVILDVNPCESIRGVKIQLFIKSDIPPDLMRLVYEGQLLKDENTLQDYNIKNDSTIYWVLRPIESLNEKEDGKPGEMNIYIKKISGQMIVLTVNSNDRIEDVKAKIQKKEDISPDQFRLIYAGRQLLKDETLQYYNIKKDATLHMCLTLRGGGFSPLPARTFYKVNTDDLVSIVAEQKVEGCWNSIPSYLTKSIDPKIKAAIHKVQQWAKNKRLLRNENKVVGTVISMFYMVSCKKEFHTIWGLVYEKALKWLISINKNVNWEAIIKSL